MPKILDGGDQIIVERVFAEVAFDGSLDGIAKWDEVLFTLGNLLVEPAQEVPGDDPSNAWATFTKG